MALTPTFRPATAADAGDLAILFDAATRRQVSWFWGLNAKPGQSWFEVGRDRIRNNTASDSHYSKWQVATLAGEIVGALCSHRIADPYDPGDLNGVPQAVLPFIELEGVAAGTYNVFVASVFREYRGKGIGHHILEKATELARQEGATRLSLIVESFNPDAHRFYRRYGFRDWESRPFVAFPGSEEEGELILMVKDLA